MLPHPEKGRDIPWASTTHRHSLQLPFPISHLLCRQELADKDTHRLTPHPVQWFPKANSNRKLQ